MAQVPQGSSSSAAPFDPLSRLNDGQKAIFEKFKAKVAELDLTPEEELWADDMCLIRYLRAREYDLTKAFNLFQGTLKWRKEFGVEAVDPETLYEETATGKTYQNGKDLFGRPILYLRNDRQNTKDLRKNIELLVYCFESCFREMDKSKGVEQLCVIMDFTHFSMWNMPPVSSTLAFADILLNHCPERLGVAYFVNPPTAFSILWKLVKPLLNEHTMSKLNFISGPCTPGSKKHKLFKENFDFDQLEPDFGGSMKFEYKPKEFWDAECARHREWKAQQAELIRAIEEKRAANKAQGQ